MWHPTRFERWEDCDQDCSTGVARIQTDAGSAYLKALGNAEGPHSLVREWVGTSVARWFGLTTFDFAKIELEPGHDIALGKEKVAEPGPAFVTRAEAGLPWSGKAADLKHLVNPEAVTGLVMVDTWLLNADRFPPVGSKRGPNWDNVFLSTKGLKGKQRRLVAMDFSDCMKPPVSLSSRIADIGNTKDERLFGLFPDFRHFLQWEAYAAGHKRLQQASRAEMEPLVSGLPEAWDVSPALREALTMFLTNRAAFLVGHLPGLFRPYFGDHQMGIEESS
jgi:hypothetical protein